MNQDVEIGILGGSGLYDMNGVSVVDEMRKETPYGRPSDTVSILDFHGRKVAFIPRHGEHHSILPSEINYRANIYVLKSLGVRRLLSVGAVGSLREKIEPTHLGVPDQIVDRTVDRARSFFGDGVVAHVSLSYPFCNRLRETIASQATEVDAEVHRKGTYVCIEGPQFSTVEESRSYRNQGYDYIGMTVMPEARLAREAEICYSFVGMVTDYDAWYEKGQLGDTEAIVENLIESTEYARKVVGNSIDRFDLTKTCTCEQALDGALITDPAGIPDRRKRELEWIIGDDLSD